MNARKGYSIGYVYDTSDKPEGYAGGGGGLWSQSLLEAIDVRTGNIKWSHEYNDLGAGGAAGNVGILTTAGKLLVTGGSGSSLVVYNPADGKILWHFRLPRGVSNGPSTWMLDGQQYLIVGAGDTLYAFTLVNRG